MKASNLEFGDLLLEFVGTCLGFVDFIEDGVGLVCDKRDLFGNLGVADGLFVRGLGDFFHGLVHRRHIPGNLLRGRIALACEVTQVIGISKVLDSRLVDGLIVLGNILLHELQQTEGTF